MSSQHEQYLKRILTSVADYMEGALRRHGITADNISLFTSNDDPRRNIAVGFVNGELRQVVVTLPDCTFTLAPTGAARAGGLPCLRLTDFFSNPQHR